MFSESPLFFFILFYWRSFFVIRTSCFQNLRYSFLFFSIQAHFSSFGHRIFIISIILFYSFLFFSIWDHFASFGCRVFRISIILFYSFLFGIILRHSDVVFSKSPLFFFILSYSGSFCVIQMLYYQNIHHSFSFFSIRDHFASFNVVFSKSPLFFSINIQKESCAFATFLGH